MNNTEIITFDDGEYLLNREENLLTCENNKYGFKIRIKYSTDRDEINESIKAVSEFFIREIL